MKHPKTKKIESRMTAFAKLYFGEFQLQEEFSSIQEKTAAYRPGLQELVAQSNKLVLSEAMLPEAPIKYDGTNIYGVIEPKFLFAIELSQAYKSLSTRQRVLLLAIDVYSYDPMELAKMLNCCGRTVINQYKTARQKVRQHLLTLEEPTLLLEATA
jgi:DNA-directed RNA polymerase specialized sigma24 family protein